MASQYIKGLLKCVNHILVRLIVFLKLGVRPLAEQILEDVVLCCPSCDNVLKEAENNRVDILQVSRNESGHKTIHRALIEVTDGWKATYKMSEIRIAPVVFSGGASLSGIFNDLRILFDLPIIHFSK